MRPRAELPSRLLLVADGFVTGTRGLGADAVRARTRDLVRAGVRWVLLRDHDASDEAFDRDAEALADALAPATVSTAGRTGVARRLGLGVHAGHRGPRLADVRDLPLIGASAHSVREAQRAQRAGADYVALSPLFRTHSHPDAVPLGLDVLRRCARAVEVPVLALGGITPERVPACLDAGASGAAAISSLLLAPAPELVVKRFRDALAAGSSQPSHPDLP